MNSKELVAENIRKLRKSKGVSQEQMAKDLKMNPVTIRYYEYGERFPKPEAMDAISAYFNVPVSELFLSGNGQSEKSDSLDLIKQIISLGPSELEQLKGVLNTLSKPISSKKEKKNPA